MTFNILSISAEGIRGINKAVKKDVHPGLTILSGPNGAGKTSLLQSIEWCLTGRISYFKESKIPDFKEEDAYVNLFCKDQIARVTVVISDGKRNISIRRSRKVGKQTNDRSSLEVDEEGSKSYSDAEAMLFLAKTLKSSVGDFTRSVFLHQEAIHELVSENPEKRSVIIDRLLGTQAIRELIEVADPKLSISNKIKDLNKTLSTLERDKAQAIVDRRRELEEKKNELLKAGYAIPQLSKEYLSDQLNEFSQKISNLADQMSVKRPLTERATSDISIISKSFHVAERATTEVDRQRISALQELGQQRLRSANLLDEFLKSKKHLEDLKPSKALTELYKERTDLSRLIDDLNARSGALRNDLILLTNVQTKLAGIDSQVTVYRKRISAIETKWINEKGILDSVASLERNLADVRSEFARIGTLDKLVSLGMSYLEQAKPTECPICSQKIDPEHVASQLRTKTSSMLLEKSTSLEGSEDKISSEINETKDKLEDYRTSKAELVKLDKQRVESIAEAEKRRGEQFPLDIAKKIEDVSTTAEIIGNQVNAEVQRLQELDRIYRELESAVSNVNDFSKKLSLEVGGTADVTDTVSIANLVEKAKSRLKDLDSKASLYRNEKAIDDLNDNLVSLHQLLNYLQSEEALAARESELSNMDEQVQEIRSRINSLEQLEGSLGNIRQIALEYQKEAITSKLSSITEGMNYYYKYLAGHPVFHELKLIANDQKEPIEYSFRAQGDSALTHIPTRFSTAQENIVALSIFLSNHDNLSKEFGTIIFDDPVQSMDADHQERLVGLIRTLAAKKQIIVATQEKEIMEKLVQAVPSASLFKFREWTEDGCSLE